MFITKFIVGEKQGYHYKIGHDDEGKMIFYKSDVPANGNILIVKCALDYSELEAAVKFCYAFATEKNGSYPVFWIDPAIVNSYYEGLFTFAFDGNPQYMIDTTLQTMGGHNSIKNLVIYYARGFDAFKSPVVLPKVSDFEIKNESSQSNLKEKPKDISTQGSEVKESNLPLQTSNLTYMGKLYIAQNGNLILKKD